MRATTLWQPYATLIAKGVKTRETRNYAPPSGLIGQRIAIHAAKTTEGWRDGISPAIRDALAEYIGYDWRPMMLPYGAVVATALLASAHRTDGTALDPFGDYSPGRWYWQLDEIEPVDPPVPARGYQGWWEWSEAA